MYPLSDKDLDRISREAAEQTDMDQSPSGWEKLEQRLNKELPQEKEKDRRRFLWLFFAILLLSGTGTVLIYKNGQKDQPITQTYNHQSDPNTPSNESSAARQMENKNSSPNNTDKPSAPAASSPLSAPSSATNQPATNQPATADDKTTNPKITAPSVAAFDPAKTRSTATDNDRLVSGRTVNPLPKKSGLSAKQSSNIASNRSVINRSVVDRSGNSVNRKTTLTGPDSKLPNKSAITNSDKQVTETVVTEPLKNDSSVTTPDKDSVITVSVADTVAKTTNTASKKSSKSGTPDLKNRWAFAAVTGLDYTNIHGRTSSRLGFKFGLQASFNITKRLSVNTGFLLTKNFYKADSSSFHPPKHYFTYYVDRLNWIDGSCYMWDIPINIRYDVIVTPTSRWYVNAGMTSYIMRKQKYTYDYVYNSVASTKLWESGSTQNEWFKIVNLGIGWEKQLSKKWSLQAEPFIKLPLTGVGFGKMDMNTSGILLSFRYRPNFKTK